MLFRVRDLLVRQRTQAINALRGHLAEFGLVAPKGPANVGKLEAALADCAGRSAGPGGRARRGAAGADRRARCEQIAELDKEVLAEARRDPDARRLMTIPGVGPVTAMAIQAFAPPLDVFRHGRDFSAWLGLVPRQHSTAGKARLGKISKMGQRDSQKRLLMLGAMSVVKSAGRGGAPSDPWLAGMLATKKSKKLVAIALANRTARIVWAMTTRQESYRAPAPNTA